MTSPAPQVVEMGEQATAVVRGEVPMAELPAFFDRAFAELASTLADQGLAPAGPAFARYDGPPTEVARLEVGFPVSEALEPTGEVVPSSLPAGRVAHAVHVGSFEGLGEAWTALAGWITDRGEAPSDAFWEVYVTEPTPDTDPADLRTELYWRLA